MFVIWVVFFSLGLISTFFKDTNFFVNNMDTLSWIIIVICTISYCIFIILNVKNKNQYIILILAYFFRLLLLYWDLNMSSVFPLPNSGTDAEGFHLVAVQKSMGIYTSSYGGLYTTLLGFVYQIFGPQKIIGQYINLLLGIHTIIICKKILENLDIDKKKISFGIGLIAFMPNFSILNVILLRETIISFLLAISLYFFVKWWVFDDLKTFILAIAFSLFASLFHSGAISVIIGYVFCLILYDRKMNKFRLNKKSAFFLLLTLFSFAVIENTFGELIFSKFNVDSLDELNNNVMSSRGGSGYSVGFDFGNSFINLIMNTPIRMFYFIFSPLPWDWRNFNDIFAFFFSSIFYGFIFIILIRTLLKKNIENNKKNIITVFLILSLSSVLLFSWGVSNAGTALRHRDKYIVQFVVAGILCIPRKDTSVIEKSRRVLL